MAHVLLPGTFPLKTQLHSTKYANNAIEEMLKQLYSFDVKKENIEVCLVGGANVLKRKGDIIGKDNLDAVEKLLREKHIEIKAKAVGGFERRTVIFDIENGCISYSVGNSKQNILWQTLLKR
ncbi:MAG: chemotaxis protein CheD [Bacteroidales bacterium]|nr:chemotaxis protein CheD [Bacteroidales bacterium]